jgi:ubiquinone/menaquinone biosynthesis C-methylase UbiE
MNNIEEKRLRDEYSKRDINLPWNDWKTNIYHPRNPIGNLFQEHNHTILVDVLNQQDINLSDLKILDVGCGYGSWLQYLVELGAKPKNCVGIDLSEHRLNIAKNKNPSITWYQQNISELPFPDESFDFVIQSVVLSSILDMQMIASCVAEMNRVTKKGGNIFWIDLANIKSDTLVSFSESDVKKLFPKMQIIYKRRVHPKYFRRIYGKYAWLAKAIYQFTGSGCESQLFLLRKLADV